MNDYVDEIFLRFRNNNESPVTELYYTNDFTLLVAIILSAQSTDKGVNKITHHLFQVVNKPQDIVNIGLESLKKYINSIGLYNTKAQNIILMSNILINKYDSVIPKEFDLLLSLPGVGRKTANVFLNCTTKKKCIAVDTHVKRVSNRLGLTNSNNFLVIEQKLHEVISERWLSRAHNWLVLHGRYVCKARAPNCENCILNDLCPYAQIR